MVRFTLVLALVLAGCQTLSSDAGRDDTATVQIVEEEDAVANCTQVEEVRVAAPFRFLTRTIPESSAIGRDGVQKSLRYQAWLVGGDTVLEKEVEEGMTVGMAYDCK